MAATHQTEPPVATPPETTIVPPRADDPGTTVAPEIAAREAKEKMSKTQGFWNRLAPDKEEAKPAKPEKPVEAQPEKPPKEKETKEKRETSEKTESVEGEAPKPETKTRKKKEAEIDPIELARATGQEIGREMAKANQNVPRGTQPATPEAEPELPEEFRAVVDVFEEMSRLDPKRYGNIKKELARYAQAESDYIAKWEKEHEGDTYDGDDPEHNAFYDKARPNYDQKDFKAAERSLVKQEVLKEASAEMRQRETEAEQRRERASQIQPEVERDMASTITEMIREIEPDNSELKDWKTLEEKNPLLSDIVVSVHDATKPAIAATMRLFRYVEPFNPANPVHNQIADVVEKAEQRVSQLPMKDRYDDDGRLFARQADYAKMTPDEKARHWFIGEREVVALLKGQAIAQTKTIYERESQRIARYTKRNNATQTTEPAAQPPAKKPEPAPQPKPDNGSPSVSGRGTLPGDGQSAASKPTTGRDLFFGKMFGA